MPESLPHAIILNPKSAGGKGYRKWKRLLRTPFARKLRLADLPLFDGKGCDPPLQLLNSLVEWVCFQYRTGARNFVVCGGDGTLNLAIHAALIAEGRGRIPVAHLCFGAIGLGSSNDFHKPFSSAFRKRLGQIPVRLDYSSARAHDIGILRMPMGEIRYFVVNCSLGVTAEANDFFNRAGGAFSQLKRRWVDGAILTAALITFAQYRNFRVRLETDGQASREIFLSNLGVIKNRHFSGSFRYDKGPRADDALLGVHVCESMSRIEMLKTLGALARGRFSGLPKASSSFATRVRVEALADEPFAVETDGEVTRTKRVDFEILERRMLLCP